MSNVVLYNIILMTRNKKIKFTRETAKCLGNALFLFLFFNDWKIEKVRIGLDYAQIVIWFPDNEDMDDAVRRMKKSSERLVGHKFKDILGKASFWSKGYYVGTVGDVDRSQDDWWSKIDESGLCIKNTIENLK